MAMLSGALTGMINKLLPKISEEVLMGQLMEIHDEIVGWIGHEPEEEEDLQVSPQLKAIMQEYDDTNQDIEEAKVDGGSAEPDETVRSNAETEPTATTT